MLNAKETKGGSCAFEKNKKFKSVSKKGASKKHKINFVAQFEPISASLLPSFFKSINFHHSNSIHPKIYEMKKKTYIKW